MIKITNASERYEAQKNLDKYWMTYNASQAQGRDVKPVEGYKIISSAELEKLGFDSDAWRSRKLSATPDLSGTVLLLCPITNSASKSV